MIARTSPPSVRKVKASPMFERVRCGLLWHHIEDQRPRRSMRTCQDKRVDSDVLLGTPSLLPDLASVLAFGPSSTSIKYRRPRIKCQIGGHNTFLSICSQDC